MSLAILSRYGWTALNGVRWTTDPSNAISHVAIGPGGVAIVDEKVWTRSVTLENGVLRHGGYRCERDLEKLAAECATVTALLAPEHRSAVNGVLCVTSRDLPAAPTGGVHVVGRMHLASFLVDLPPRLSALEVADIARELARCLLDPSAAASWPAIPVARPAAHATAPGNDASGYFVPRSDAPEPQASPVEVAPHPVTARPPVPVAAPVPAPVPRPAPAPAPPVPVPAPMAATNGAPVVRVSGNGWPGDELVARPALPVVPAPVGERYAPCWPGDEPRIAHPAPSATPGWPTEPVPDNWIGVPEPADPADQFMPDWVGAPRVTSPGWPGSQAPTTTGWSGDQPSARGLSGDLPSAPPVATASATSGEAPAGRFTVRMADAVRLGAALVVALFVFGNNTQIAMAVSDWLEPTQTVVTVESAQAHTLE